MGKRLIEKKETLSLSSLRPDAQEKLNTNETAPRQGKRVGNGLYEAQSDDSNSLCLEVDEAWIMQTSSGYEDFLIYEDQSCMDNRDKDERFDINEGTDKGAVRQERKTTNKEKEEETESREEKIKKLKLLIQKQEKAVDKLKPTIWNKRPVSLHFKGAWKNQPHKTKWLEREKRPSKGGLETRARRQKRRKIEYADIITNSRDVDILMSRGELITKDEFLAVIGLNRVGKFHENQS